MTFIVKSFYYFLFTEKGGTKANILHHGVKIVEQQKKGKKYLMVFYLLFSFTRLNHIHHYMFLLFYGKSCLKLLNRMNGDDDGMLGLR